MNITKKQLLRDRRALLDEIAALQEENLRLRTGEPPAPPLPDTPEDEAIAPPGTFSRFPLLRAVDEKYEPSALDSAREPSQPRQLPQVAEHLRRFAAAHFGLYADRALFAYFLGAMAASDFLLLRGEDSAPGPLTLCRAVAAAWGQDIELIPVQPIDGGDILGGPDPAAKRWHETDLLRAVYEAGYDPGVRFTVLEGAAAAPPHCFSRLLPLLSLSHNDASPFSQASLVRSITLAETAWPEDPALLQNGVLPWPGNLWAIAALPPGQPPAPHLRAAAMEFCTPAGLGTKAFLTPLESPAPLSARQLRDLFARAREVHSLPEETLRLYGLAEQYLAENMDLSLGARARAQLGSFGSVCLACGLPPVRALDGFLFHNALRRLESADPAALKYELPGLRRFFGDSFGRRALPLTMSMLDGMLNS